MTSGDRAKSITLLVSKLSGRGEAFARGIQVARILRRGGWQVHFRVLRSGVKPDTLVAESATRFIGAVGGDGFIARVARATVKSAGRVLVPFPGGSGNDFCRALGVGISARKRAENLAQLRLPELEARIERVDGMRVLTSGGSESQLTWGVVSLGIDATANLVANQSRFLRGSLSYIWGGLQAFLQEKPAAIRGVIDGYEYDLSGWIASVSNSGWMGGGINIVPDSRLDDGRLELFNVGPVQKWRAAPLLARVLSHGRPNSGLVGIYVGEEFSLRTAEPRPVMADGDLVGYTPATVTVVPRVLSVLR